MTAFLKMHGLGNDFAVFDARKQTLAFDAATARAIADRRLGVGCDQVIVIAPAANGADAAMRIYNSDGGEVESCGNAARCVAQLLMAEKGADTIRLETVGGPLVCSEADGLVTVDMGAPRFDWKDVPLSSAVDTNKFSFSVDGVSLEASALSVGNPHCVIFVGDADNAPVSDVGPLIEHHSLFPERVNVEFATVQSRGRIRMRVWERGAGITQACGTGACATAVAAARRGVADRKVDVVLDGGTLTIEWRESDGHILMTGPATLAWRGEIDLLDGALMALDVVTFGCRLNAYESEAIKARAGEAGLADAIVFNTCAVTAEAVRQSRQAIRKARRENPGKRIIVTGCAAQTESDTYSAMPEVDFVIGNAEKLEARSYANFIGGAERVRVNDIMALKETGAQFVDSFEGRARAFLQVQNGCDHRCTFCIIPYGRGNSRSVPMGAVVDEARRLTENGFPEIVLTGVDLTSYGADLPGAPTLGALVRKILKLVPELMRLRISSIDSIEADDELMRAIAEEDRLMPHFHLSAQSGDDMILKRMKRRHSRTDTIRFCEEVRARRPDAAFGADFIAGFPTETEEMFENTLRLVDDAGLSMLHVFPFSPRKGTPAARMPQLSKPLVKERAARLRAHGEAALAARMRVLAGTEQKLLIEKSGMGRTSCFAPAYFEGSAEPGAILRAKITGANATSLKAELLQ